MKIKYKLVEKQNDNAVINLLRCADIKHIDAYSVVKPTCMRGVNE